MAWALQHRTVRCSSPARSSHVQQLRQSLVEGTGVSPSMVSLYSAVALAREVRTTVAGFVNTPLQATRGVPSCLTNDSI